MPCPYFLPLAPEPQRWLRPPRAPLGALYRGECHAGASPAPADHRLCNFGYARDACPRFPADAPVDAVRFVRRGAEVTYIAEREHVPVHWGAVRPGACSMVLEAQARALTHG
jgi:hypothetical protein